MQLTSAEFRRVFAAWATVMHENRERLIELDGVVGDGDLGLTMEDGFAAASRHAEGFADADLGNLFYFSGKAIATAVPSTMGTLMASGLMSAGKKLKGRTSIDAAELGTIFAAFEEGIMQRGKAKAGEKTVLDGLAPAVKTLSAAAPGADIGPLLEKAAAAAEAGAQATIGMLAKHGRAAGRGEQSRGLLDPGAVVGALLVRAAVDCITGLL